MYMLDLEEGGLIESEASGVQEFLQYLVDFIQQQSLTMVSTA